MSKREQENFEFLFGRLDYERVGMPRVSELRLRRMRTLLSRLDDPQSSLRIVHVAGTKGKGSTSAMIAAALAHSGRSVGLFSSPHLHNVEERVRINGQAIDSVGLCELIEIVRPVVHALDARAAVRGTSGPTFFEITTAMGLLHFARRKVDAVVLEVGLGGRLDSTNSVRPMLSVITNISYDHTRQLGNTLESIASEKAGIVKRGGRVVCGVRGADAREAIDRAIQLRKARARWIDSDFSFEYQPPAQPLSKPSAGSVRVRTWKTNWGEFELPLLGPHQAWNAAIALAALDALAEQGLETSRSAVVSGFSDLAWPARIEILGRRPTLVVDGAHNVASAQALAETLRVCFPESPRILVFGTTREKDMAGQLEALLPLFSRVIAARYVENPRSVPPEEVAACVLRLSGKQASIAPDPAKALALAAEAAEPASLICVTGSLFLAAEARAVVLGIKSRPASPAVLL